jgi:hypothetical protein
MHLALNMAKIADGRFSHRPQDQGEQCTAAEKLAHRAAVKDWVKQYCTARSTILLGMELQLQAS